MPPRAPLAAVFVTWLALALSAAGARAEPPHGTVRSTRGQAVYVDLGRKDGIKVDDVLTTPSGKLRVVHLGERQLMAEVVTGAVPRPGAAVKGKRERPTGSGLRPVVTLPTPTAPGPSPWRDEAAHRAALVPVPPSAARPATSAGVRGDVRVGWISLLDDGPGDLDLHRAELRTTLDAPALATVGGGRLGWRHDVAGRLELGPGLDTRAGADSRPYVRIRELALRWSSAGWSDNASRREAAALSAALGRLAAWEATSPGLVDGARADLALGGGVSAGVYGGVVPALLDIGPSTDSAVVGGNVAWAGDGDDWRVRAALTSAVALWRGALSRIDVGGSALVALGRDFDLWASAVGTAVDPDLVVASGGARQPAFSLTRGFAGLRVRPAWWLTIDGSYAHDRVVADRETVARLGGDALVTDPRESAWLQLRFEPAPAVTIAVSGALGFGDDAAEQQGAAARLTLRDIGVAGLRTALGWRFTQTPVVQAHTADADLAIDLGDAVWLDLGYSFATFHARRLDERQDEHRVTLGADIAPRAPWRVHLGAFIARGDEPGQLGVSAQLVWRFR